MSLPKEGQPCPETLDALPWSLAEGTGKSLGPHRLLCHRGWGLSQSWGWGTWLLPLPSGGLGTGSPPLPTEPLVLSGAPTSPVPGAGEGPGKPAEAVELGSIWMRTDTSLSFQVQPLAHPGSPFPCLLPASEESQPGVGPASRSTEAGETGEVWPVESPHLPSLVPRPREA